MSRVPIRLRLTLVFAAAMALVLAGTGLFLYLRLASGLDQTINQGLRARGADVSALVQQADTGLREAQATSPSGGFAQVLLSGGGLFDWTSGLSGQPLLTKAELARASHGTNFISTTLQGEHVRLLAFPFHAQNKQLVIVVGASLEPRINALDDLRTQLLLGGPIALLLASLAGYLLAGAALRPVERMGEQAATISAASPGRRLPVPPAEDELARLGRRLNEMLARLEAAHERERNFVAEASHELRTPLALMKTEIELALDEPGSDSSLRSALHSAGVETDRLAQLADDLLLLARADAGALALRRSRVEVADLLDAVAARYRRRADEAARRIEVDVSESPTILADQRRLEQALGNLVENALRHGAGRIRLEVAQHDGQLELRIRDEGKGFPSAFLEHAFERFSRPDSSRSRRGAGLGLGIVAAIAEAHGGTATAGNGEGGGAEVTISLPRRMPPS